MTFPNSTPFGPYFVHNEVGIKERTAKGEQFKLFISAAHNAMGLIGSEADGIVILNDSRMEVVVDEIERSGNGYHGPNAKQVEELDRLLGLPDDDFLSFIRQHPRWRGEGTICEETA